MAGIKLDIGTHYHGEGLQKLDNALKASSGKVKSISRDVGGLVGRLGDVGGAASSVTGLLGSLMGILGSGGPWGIAIGAVSALVGWFVKLRGEVKDNEEASRNLTKRLQELHRQRVKMHEEEAKRKKAKDDAAHDKKVLKAQQDLLKRQLDSIQYMKEYEKTMSDLKRMEIEKGLESEDENERLKARVKLLAFAANEEVKAAKERLKNAVGETGENSASSLAAAANLQRAEANRAKAKREAAALIKAQEDAVWEAEQKEEDAKDVIMRRLYAEEEAAKKREQLEQLAAKHRVDGIKKIKELEEQIARARQEAQRLEDNAARARGVSFGTWSRGERNLAKQQEQEKSLTNKRLKSATAERDRLAAINPKAMTDWQKRRLGELNTYLANQDPNNNPMLKEVDRLQKERDEVQKKLLSNLEDIADMMKTLGT